MSPLLGLYIHIPFCRQRCDFCSFYLEIYREGAATRFLKALHTEIDIHAKQNEIRGRPFQSVYFGGGTPTILGAPRLLEVLGRIRRSFPLTPACEITVEAHPATVSKEDLHSLADGGVTRISFGAESMNDHELVRIGRPGLSSDTVSAVLHARAAGFTNINLDLMYGLPGQSVEGWRDTLDRCLMLCPTHLSCYALTIEEGTRLAHAIESGRSPAVDEQLQAAMDESTQEVLGLAGYERYEISNYAKPGHACRHNLLYWTHGEYLGVGPSAQSFLDGVRFGNVANLNAYQVALTEPRLPQVDRIVLTDE
jgi:oxygen-independent coproporphyrinogen-3 oxidase